MKKICSILLVLFFLTNSVAYGKKPDGSPDGSPTGLPAAPAANAIFDLWLLEGDSFLYYTPAPAGNWCQLWQITFAQIFPSLPGLPDEAWVTIHKETNGEMVLYDGKFIREYEYVVEDDVWPGVWFYYTHWLEVKAMFGKTLNCVIAFNRKDFLPVIFQYGFVGAASPLETIDSEAIPAENPYP